MGALLRRLVLGAAGILLLGLLFPVQVRQWGGYPDGVDPPRIKLAIVLLVGLSVAVVWVSRKIDQMGKDKRRRNVGIR